MVKVKDVISDYIISNSAYIYKLIKEMFPEWQPDTNMVCTFHEEANASLSVSSEGKAYCHGCGFRAANIIELYSHVHAVSYMEARTMLYEGMVNAIPEHKVEAYTRALTKKHIQWLKDVRHLSDDTILKYQLGYDTYTKRTTIPIRDKFGTCVNIRKHSSDSKIKMINMKGHGEFRLFPESVLLDSNNKNILLVEGEFDALVGLSACIPTVTGTGGAGSWDSTYNWMFQNKNVFVLYDNDEPGHEGAEAVYQSLRGTASYITKLDPPSQKGKDLSDWYQHTDWIKWQIDEMVEDYASPDMKCMSCGKSIKNAVSMSPTSGLCVLDVCNVCKLGLVNMKWEVVR